MTSDEEALRALLLHRLPDQQMEAHSERILLEDGFAERLRDVETDLLDDYARGVLTSKDRLAVERYLLVDGTQRERVRTARALGQLTSARRGGRRLLSWWALPTAALLAAGVAGIYLVPALLSPATSTQQVTLLADSQRSSGMLTLHLNPGVSQIRLQLEIPDAATGNSYQLAIAGLPGSAAHTTNQLSISQSGPYRFVEAKFPAQWLAPGTNRLTLTPSVVTPSAAQSYEWLLQTD